MEKEQSLVQGSMFHELVPECELSVVEAAQTIDEHAVKLIDSLNELGIRDDSSHEVHYGVITARTDSILVQSSDTAFNDLVIKDRHHADEYERYNFKNRSYYSSYEDVRGYIESMMIFEINGRLEPCLKVVNYISDMGFDDILIMLRDVAEIQTLPPAVTEAMIMLENNQWEPELGFTKETADYWYDFLDAYLVDKNSYRTVWTPSGGTISAWNN